MSTIRTVVKVFVLITGAVPGLGHILAGRFITGGLLIGLFITCLNGIFLSLVIKGSCWKDVFAFSAVAGFALLWVFSFKRLYVILFPKTGEKDKKEGICDETGRTSS